MYFRRLAASRHRSSPCSARSCLGCTRVHITVYQRGCVFFFFCASLSTSRMVLPQKQTQVLFCSAAAWRVGERKRRHASPPPQPPFTRWRGRGFSGYRFGNGSRRGPGTPEGRRSRRGPCIPALGASSSSRGIEMFGQANRVSRGAQMHPGLGEEEGFG